MVPCFLSDRPVPVENFMSTAFSGHFSTGILAFSNGLLGSACSILGLLEATAPNFKSVQKAYESHDQVLSRKSLNSWCQFSVLVFFFFTML